MKCTLAIILCNLVLILPPVSMLAHRNRTVPREGFCKQEDALLKQQPEWMLQGRINVVSRDAVGQGKPRTCRVLKDPPWKTLLGKGALENTGSM